MSRAATSLEARAGVPAPVPSRGLGIAALHPDWRRAWGRTVRGGALRAAMEGNPRLESRLLEAIGETHGHALVARPRLDRTASAVATALVEDARGFIRLCGLAHIGRRIAMATNRDDYAVLAKTFGARHLATAARIARDLPEADADHGYDSQQLGAVVERLGHAVLTEWSATQPRQSADWIAMMLPRAETGGTVVGAARAVAIVEAAAARWTPEERTGRDGDARTEAGRDGRTGGRSARRGRRDAEGRGRAA